MRAPHQPMLSADWQRASEKTPMPGFRWARRNTARPPRSTSARSASNRSVRRAVLTRACEPTLRSEERRVGKECRSQWTPDQYKKKNEQGTKRGESKDEKK